MGGPGPALCSAALAAALLAGWLAALPAWQLVLLSLLAAALCLYIKGGTPLPLPLPENNPKWITGNAYYAGVSMADNIRNFYNEMKHHKMSIYWQFGTPQIMATDLEIIKQVQTTAFDHFHDFNLIPDDYLAKMGLQLGLVDAKGEDWRTLKKLLTPAFSGPRIKKTGAAMNRVAKLLVEHLRNQETAGAEVKIMEDIEKCSMTFIAAVVFGTDVNCFKEPDHVMFKLGKSILEMWRWMAMIFTPRIMTVLRIPLCNPKATKHFEKLCHQIVEQRKGSDVERKDILDNMIRASEENALMTPEMMFKTLTQFFTDGFEGYSRITCVLVYLITAHPDVQEKLHEEIDDVLGDGDNVTDEDFGNLPYLDQVISEGLRMNPTFYTGRGCGKAFTVPGTEHTIPVGTTVIIPIAALHYDPDIWGDPETFRPDRFSPANKADIPSGAYQPFGMGPRQCIGYNIMKMQMKIMLCHLLKNFTLSPRGQMPMPLVFHDIEPMMLKEEVRVDIASR